MSMDILTNPNPELRKKSLLVDEARFGTEELKKLGEELIQAMMDDDGIGIAAPQVGIHDRIIVVNMKDTGPSVFVNPKVVSRSMSKVEFEEGCLSVPGIYGMVERPKKVKVKAKTVDGLAVTLNLKNLESVIFQHEIDHLDGILFIDKVTKFTHGGNVQV